MIKSHYRFIAFSIVEHLCSGTFVSMNQVVTASPYVLKNESGKTGRTIKLSYNGNRYTLYQEVKQVVTFDESSNRHAFAVLALNSSMICSMSAIRIK